MKNWPVIRQSAPKEDANQDALTAEWQMAFNRVSAMPQEQVDRLEKKLVDLRRGVGVTVPQMQLLRAIAARRVEQNIQWRQRRSRA
jgi:hypothetical protein